MSLYTPGQVPTSVENLHQFLVLEFQRISQAMESESPSLKLTPLSVAPLKPRDGDLAMADGTNWNPGSGAGFYGYRSGAWRFLG